MGSDVSSVCQPISSTDPDLDSDASYVRKKYLGPFLRLYFAEKPVAALRGVGYFLRIFYTQGQLRHDYLIKYAYFVKCYLNRFASISDPEK